ncbi:MAG: TPM domain-containing protein [Bacteroidota bacterium]|nr:TPM domain-containing protein [Bacteroidota bacterium]
MKLFLPCLLVIVSFSMPCCGQKDKKETASPFQSLIPEKPTDWVADLEKIFTPVQVAHLDSIINSHEAQSTNEIAIVTLQLDSFKITTPEDFNSFSLALFNQWGIGKKDKQNGIGILISTNLRQTRIEVGYGLESKLTDEEAEKIINTIILPDFKNAAYFTGTLHGLKAILKEIE